MLSVQINQIIFTMIKDTAGRLYYKFTLMTTFSRLRNFAVNSLDFFALVGELALRRDGFHD